MDRSKAKLTDSLQVRLSVALSAVVVTLAILVGIWSFVASLEDAREFQDSELEAIARFFCARGLPLPRQPPRLPSIEGNSRIVVEPLADGGERQLPLPVDAPDGMQTVYAEGVPWRVYVRTEKDGSRLAVGQQTAARDHIAMDTGLWTAIPLLILAPILCALVFFLVHRTFKPVSVLSESLNYRTEANLRPVQIAGLPSEIRPIVAAINSLFARLGQSAETQRRFIANAAHELRSPLSALSVQAENVGRSTNLDEMAARLVPLRKGITRARWLQEQLLALAYAQTPSDKVAASFDVSMVLRRVLEELLPLAEEKNIELDIVRLAPVVVAARELELTLILRNLLDNAIRYSASEGQVEIDVATAAEGARIEIKDYGPGIPEQERDRVFDPFYRILGGEETGIGLGLSIVKTVVQRLGGSITLGWTVDEPPRGLRVAVTLPQVRQGKS